MPLSQKIIQGHSCDLDGFIKSMNVKSNFDLNSVMLVVVIKRKKNYSNDIFNKCYVVIAAEK